MDFRPPSKDVNSGFVWRAIKGVTVQDATLSEIHCDAHPVHIQQVHDHDYDIPHTVLQRFPKLPWTLEVAIFEVRPPFSLIVCSLEELPERQILNLKLTPLVVASNLQAKEVEHLILVNIRKPLVCCIRCEGV